MATTKATLLGHRSATSFADLTLSGDLTVNGTTTTILLIKHLHGQIAIKKCHLYHHIRLQKTKDHLLFKEQ